MRTAHVVMLSAFLIAFSSSAFGWGDFGPRPARWCGWQMRQWVTSDPGPAFNQAIKWKEYGSYSPGPCLGCIVIWRHHVGQITGRSDEGWIVRSGNDQHQVRERPRSLARVVAYRQPLAMGSRYTQMRSPTRNTTSCDSLDASPRCMVR